MPCVGHQAPYLGFGQPGGATGPGHGRGVGVLPKPRLRSPFQKGAPPSSLGPDPMPQLPSHPWVLAQGRLWLGKDESDLKLNLEL